MEDFNNKNPENENKNENAENNQYNNAENKQNAEKKQYYGDLNDIFDGRQDNNGSSQNNPYQGYNPYQNNNYGQNNPYAGRNFQQNNQNYQNNPYQGFNPYQNNPYNGMAARLYPQPKGERAFVKVFISIFLAIMIFASGFLMAYSVFPSEEEKLARWIKSTSERYFYDVDGSGVNFIDNLGNSMVGSLDQYSSFYAGGNLKALYDENKGVFNDTGMILKQFGNYVIVFKLYRNSPAELAGLKVGDIIKEINGKDVSTLNDIEIRDKIRALQAEDKGAEIKFKFARVLNGIVQPPFEVTFGRREYNPVFSVYYDSEEIKDAGLDEDTAYISFEEFSANADNQFAENLGKFKEKGKKKLILDLRTNFGGSLDILQGMASHLITDSVNSEKVLVINAQFKDKVTRQGFYTKSNDYASYGFEKIVAIANEYSASATEVLLCAMKDYGTLTGLVGKKTYGKAVMQSFFQYGNNYGMYITTALLFSPVKDKTYNTVGFYPDEGYTEEFNLSGEYRYDNQFLKAVSMING